MSVRITIDLPDELAERARAAAVHAQRDFEDLLVEWIARAVTESPVDTLPDDQVLALCDSQLDERQQEVLSDLLAASRDGTLAGAERSRLDDLLRIYRRGLVRKAQVLHTAVQSGLKSPLG